MRLSSFSFTEWPSHHLKVVTSTLRSWLGDNGSMTHEPASVQSQAERSWLLDRCAARMLSSSSRTQLHRLTRWQQITDPTSCDSSAPQVHNKRWYALLNIVQWQEFPSGLPTLYLADENALFGSTCKAIKKEAWMLRRGLTGPISRTPALMGNYGKDPVLNEEYSKP